MNQQTDPQPWVSLINPELRAESADAFPEHIATHGLDYSPRTSTTYVCKSCAGLAPVGVGYAATGTEDDARKCAERIACECGASRTAAAWAVLNCAVTQVLGLYSTEAAAEAAATWYGSCSFPYRLSDTERDRLIEA